DHWPANSNEGSSVFSFTYLRQVVAKSGNHLLLDAPIPWTLDPLNNPVRIRLAGDRMKENVGIKGLRIGFENNRDSSTGRPHGTGVYFERVRNGWAYDVAVTHFPRNGIYARFSARITFLDCRVTGAQDYGGGGYGYAFNVYASQNMLIKRCYAEDNRHNFLTERSLVSTVVWTQCVSVN